MAGYSEKHIKKMDPADVLKFVREHDDPAVTATEVAEGFDVSNRSAQYRLDQLEEMGKVRGKDVGSAAKVWFPVG